MVKLRFVLFFINLVIGLYFVNKGFDFIGLPEFILSIDKWILIVGGAMIIISGILVMKGSSDSY